MENHRILYDTPAAMTAPAPGVLSRFEVGSRPSDAAGAKCSASETLLVGYDAVQRTEQNRVAAGTRHSRARWNLGVMMRVFLPG